MNPFIIWTVQRTGGTNIAVNLIRQSGLPTTEHEPLNEDRAYGHISRNWQNHKNEQLLDQEIGKFLDKGYAFKHCVENVAWPVNHTLLHKSVERNYSHLILYREHALNRLLSLHFAKETGLWGRKKVSALMQDKGGNFLETVPVGRIDADVLIQHEEVCTAALFRITKELKEQDAPVCVASFEDIYEASPSLSEKKLYVVLRTLGFPLQETASSFQKGVRQTGDQRTKKVYAQIAGFAELQARLDGFSLLKERLQSVFPDLV